MRRLLSCLLLFPLLSGCGDQSTQTPVRPLTEVELRPYYVDTPARPLPEYTAFALGESYQPVGTVTGWKGTKVVPLYAGPDQTLVPAAQLQPDGRITGAAPLKPGRTETLQSILSMGGWVGGLCVMDGLKAAASINVVLPESTYFFVRLSDLQQQMQPLTSPPVPAGRVLSHDLQAYDQQFALAMSQLVYVPEDVTVQGEQRCLRGFEQSNSISVNQNSIQVNLKLTRGWNALVRLNTSTDKQNNGAGILLSDTVWRTVPHEAIERWK